MYTYVCIIYICIYMEELYTLQQVSHGNGQPTLPVIFFIHGNLAFKFVRLYDH